MRLLQHQRTKEQVPFTTGTHLPWQAAANAAVASSQLEDDEDADLAAAIAASLAGAPLGGSTADSIRDPDGASGSNGTGQQQLASSAPAQAAQPSSNGDAHAGMCSSCTAMVSSSDSDVEFTTVP